MKKEIKFDKMQMTAHVPWMTTFKRVILTCNYTKLSLSLLLSPIGQNMLRQEICNM